MNKEFSMNSKHLIEKIFNLKNVDFWKVILYGYRLNLIDDLFLINLAMDLLITDTLNDSLVIDLAALSEKNPKMAGNILAEKLKIDFFDYETKVIYNKIWFSMLLNDKINFLLAQITHAENIESSQDFFEELHKIQGNIVRFIMEDQPIMLSDNLKEFIYDFERIDDKSTQEFVFKKIKNGSYIPT